MDRPDPGVAEPLNSVGAPVVQAGVDTGCGNQSSAMGCAGAALSTKQQIPLLLLAMKLSPRPVDKAHGSGSCQLAEREACARTESRQQTFIHRIDSMKLLVRALTLRMATSFPQVCTQAIHSNTACLHSVSVFVHTPCG